MHTYFAISSKLIKTGGLNECFQWSQNLIGNKKAKLIKIAKARPNEKQAKIVFEVSKESVTATPNGRYVSLVLLKREEKDGS